MEWCPYISVLCLTSFLSGVFSKRAGRVVVTLIELWGAAEGILAASQIFGYSRSNHSLFALTGTFDNPGPLGGFLAVAFAVALCDAMQNHRHLVGPFKGSDMMDAVSAWLAGGCAAICLILLPATMSRTGWIAAIVPISLYAFALKPVKEYLSRHKGLAWGICAFAAVLLLSAFFLKKDSALGRLHIWHIETLAIARKPFTGWGFGKELGAYGMVQHDYFASSDRSDLEQMVAGCPEYPFNEYLGIGVAGGIPALLIMLAILFLALRRLKGTPLFYGLTALAVFAFGSYPLSLSEFRIVIALMLGVAFALPGKKLAVWVWAAACLTLIPLTIHSVARLSEQRRAKEEVKYLSFSKSGYYYEGLANRLGQYRDILKNDYRYLYELGLALNKEGQHAMSNEVLLEGAGLSSDPMFHNILGKNLQALGEFEGAEAEFRYASLMVPSRLYPHVLLMRLYIRQGADIRAMHEAERILQMPINEKNQAMLHLRDQVLYTRDSLRTLAAAGQDT